MKLPISRNRSSELDLLPQLIDTPLRSGFVGLRCVKDAVIGQRYLVFLPGDWFP